MTDKSIEEKIQDILLTLVEFDGDHEKGFATSVDVKLAQKALLELFEGYVKKGQTK